VEGYSVRYTTSAELLEDLIRASGERRLPSRVRYYSRFDLLIIDEFGFEKLERLEYPESPSLLYKVIDRRNRRGSTALVTNVDFQDWTSYLGDPPLAMALLDRVVDGAIVQKFKGKSYRDYRSQHKNGAPYGTPGKPTNGHPAAWHDLGLVEMAAGQLKAAESRFRRSLELNPYHGTSLNNLGLVLLQQNRISEGIEILQKAIQIQPHDKRLRDLLEKAQQVRIQR
jgi:tetratricopeptide (TPR) repeat protein